MLSTIPKLADKTFIIGYLFPTTAFLVALLFLLSDISPFSSVNDLIQSDKNFDKVIYLGLLVWGLSIILMILNHSLYQIIEGYTWPIPQLAKRLGSKQLQRFRQLSTRLEDLGLEWEAWGESFPNLPFPKEQEYDDLLIELKTKFPSKDKLVLPTRFGNAIAAFEDYPRDIYGADPIPLWIHLNTVIPKEFQSSVEDARTSVTFLMNLFIFSTLLFIISLCRSAVHSLETLAGYKSGAANFRLSVIFVIVSALLACGTYKLSVDKAYAWGTLVKAAFDCYLPALAKKLGYKLPLKGEDQNKFWTAISRRAAYQRELKPEDWPRLVPLESDQCSRAAGAVEGAGEENGSNSEGDEGDGDGSNAEDELEVGGDSET
jgi:hypothetical protein